MRYSTPLPDDDLEEPDVLSFMVEHGGYCFDCIVDVPLWKRLLTADVSRRMGAILAEGLSNEGRANVGMEISILFTNDDAVAALNKKFLNKTGATDVLSFPSDDGGFLGDIALAYETVMEQADAMKIPPEDHVLHLLLHGVLHCCGYDHIDDGAAEIMETLEAKILNKHGISNPYLSTPLGEEKARA